MVEWLPMERDVKALISQAVISRKFEKMLLASPDKAIVNFQNRH
jgi:hypothetical protein